MDESFLPWWLVLLLGMWAAALTLWQHPSVHREVRLWAGLSTLVYLGLIFLALGLGGRVANAEGSWLAAFRLDKVGLAGCVIVSLTSSVWMLGRLSVRSRRLCYVLLTTSNAAFCALVQGPEMALGLLVIAAISAWPLIQEWRRTTLRSPREWLVGLVRFTETPVPRDQIGLFWLIGGLNGILACALIGTLAYSLRIETSRISASPRYTALPSREQLDRMQTSFHDPAEKSGLLDLATGQRADVVVLLAAIVFLSLATSLNDASSQQDALKEPAHEHSSEHLI